MQPQKTFSIHYIFFFLFGIIALSNAQTINADSTFVVIKKLAEQKEYTKAIELTKQLEKEFPQDKTYSFYLVNLYNWSAQHQQALEQLTTIIPTDIVSEEEIWVYITTYRNNEQYKQVIDYCDKGLALQTSQNAARYTIEKAKALLALQKEKEAINLLESFSKGDEKYEDAQYLLTELNRSQKNTISLGYLLTTFAKPDHFNNHFVHLEYNRKWNDDSVSGRVTYGDAFDTNGVMAEVDYYKGLSKSYLYVNAGVSNDNLIFPDYKFGVEWYKETQKLTYSVGGRYLNFNEADNATIFTGHFGYKFNPEYTVGYRPYAVTVDNNWNFTQTLFLRKNYESKESYWQLDLQYGTVPYYFLTSAIVTDLNSYRAGINSRIRLKSNFFIHPIFLYEYQEYLPDTYRNVLNFQFICSYRF